VHQQSDTATRQERCKHHARMQQGIQATRPPRKQQSPAAAAAAAAAAQGGGGGGGGGARAGEQRGPLPSHTLGTSERDFQPPKAVPTQRRPVTSWKGRVAISLPDAATPMTQLVPHPLPHTHTTCHVPTLPHPLLQLEIGWQQEARGRDGSEQATPVTAASKPHLRPRRQRASHTCPRIP
jgi:hypothetical protein